MINIDKSPVLMGQLKLLNGHFQYQSVELPEGKPNGINSDVNHDIKHHQ